MELFWKEFTWNFLKEPLEKLIFRVLAKLLEVFLPEFLQDLLLRFVLKFLPGFLREFFANFLQKFLPEIFFNCAGLSPKMSSRVLYGIYFSIFTGVIILNKSSLSAVSFRVFFLVLVLVPRSCFRDILGPPGCEIYLSHCFSQNRKLSPNSFGCFFFT